MHNIDKYDLLSNMISLIKAGNYPSTIKNLATDCNVPLPYMRNTMISLLQNPIMQSCLSTMEDYSENNDQVSFIEQFNNHPAEICALITSGHYDNWEWVIEFDRGSSFILVHNQDELLPLSRLEYSSIKEELKETKFSLSHSTIFEKKENVKPLTPEMWENLEIIQDAIARKKAVRYSYEKNNKEIKTYTVFPTGISINVSENWHYMQSADGHQYRLDRFKQKCKIVDSDEPYPEIIEKPLQKYGWGIYLEKDLAPVHVKLRITNSPAIITRIQRDIHSRIEAGTAKLTAEDQYYLYEDDVLGLEEFKRWIRGYGTSILVLEPLSIRDQMLQGAKDTLGYYKMAASWQV